MSVPRIALMGPFSIHALVDHLPGDIWTQLPAGAGGAALVNLALARLKRGLPTDIITLDPQAPAGGTRIEHGPLRLWIIPRRPRRAMRDLYRKERTALRQALLSAQPDVCHAHWTYEYGMAAVDQNEVPAVVTVHDHAGHMLRWCGPKFAPLFIMARHVLKRARHLTAVSPATADYAQKVSGRPVNVIANCLSHIEKEPDKTADETTSHPCIAGAWSWATYRNTRRGLRAFALLRQRQPHAQLRLMGVEMHAGGPAESWAKQRGLSEGVTFLGLPPWNEARGHLLSADVVFHPSLEESFSLPVAESLARGVPVVAARQAAGPSWLVKQSSNGVLVDGNDESAMASALFDCLSGRGTKSTEEGIARIRALCEPDSVLNAYNDVYAEAISCHKKRRHE